MSRPTHFLSEEFFADPYPTYRRFQAQGPAVWVDELGGWLVTRFAGCREVLFDHERFSSARASQMIEAMVPGFRFEQLLPRIVCDALEQDFLFLDPPQHGRIRKELALALRMAMAEVEPALGDLAQELARGLEVCPRCDIVRDFAARIPAIAMGMMFGITREQAEEWQHWTFVAGPLFGGSPALADEARRACMLASVQELNEAIAELLFLTEVETPLLVQLRQLVKTRVWTPEEGLGAAVQLFAAGVLTTGDALTLGLLELLADPIQATYVESGASSLDQVIDEILRFTSPAQVMHRVVRTDTELDGVELRRGDLIYAVIAAANRDPGVFSEPDRFDVMRSDGSKHLGFGVGIHRCVGAGLARLELRAALPVVVPRLRHWAVDGRPHYRDYSICFRGLDTLTFAVTQPATRACAGASS